MTELYTNKYPIELDQKTTVPTGNIFTIKAISPFCNGIILEPVNEIENYQVIQMDPNMFKIAFNGIETSRLILKSISE